MTTSESAIAHKPQVTVLLAELRGVCAGVSRAVLSVERALEKFGAPVYVRHEIVHNQYIVESLKKRGVVFVKELDEIPNTDQPVIFSAHGVSKTVVHTAKSRGMFTIDATCPLVTRIHNDIKAYFDLGYKVLLIGHAGHPEVEGTMGQLPEGAISLIETLDDVEKLEIPADSQVVCICQTTLSVDDASAIVSALCERFPRMVRPRGEGVCYATTNRQEAVKLIAKQVDLFIVVGAPNSSNSQRLKETAEREGCPAFLVQYVEEIDWDSLKDVPVSRIGLSSGASTPEVLVRGVLDALSETYDVTVETVSTATEDITFGLPKVLRGSDTLPHTCPMVSTVRPW